MYLSLNWLKDFVKIPKNITPEELGARLTLHTVEVEKVKKQGENLGKVVVGEILEIKKHPNADKLSMAQVDVGEKKPRQIIFGQMAKMEVGYKTPVALAPTTLLGNKEIKQTEIRGEISEGMFCSDQEIGLIKEGASIHFFEKSVKNGTPIIKALGLNDVVFEIDNKSLTNRPDLWGHYGMARDISAIFGVKLKKYNANAANLNANAANVNTRISVDVKDNKLCPRYMAIAMDGIKIGPAPKWMQERLIAVGQKPINNIVDITNYVMLELGQPMHAFDAVKSAISNFQFLNSVIIVRRAKKGEVIETLDGEKRKLDNNMLVITDKEKPIAIAGVMGGANSEIREDTNSIVLECANFDYVSIRKTSQKLGLRTESSMRFEKGLDPNLCEIALGRAVELIKEICPKAKAASNLVDVKKFKLNQGPIELDLEWFNKRIGKQFNKKQVVKILSDLGFTLSPISLLADSTIQRRNGFEKRGAKKKIKNRRGNVLKITIPTWRAVRDVSIAEDLVEEVVRIYGYNNLESSMPKVEMQAPEINKKRMLERKVKHILVGAPALTEVYNYSFAGEEYLEKLGIDYKNYICLSNPIAKHHSMLRQSLAPSLIFSVKNNQANFESFGLFEIGSIYLSKKGDVAKDNKGNDFLPYQEKHLAIALVAQNKNDIFSKLKGIVEFLISSFDLPVSFKELKLKPTWADDNICAAISIEGRNIGIVALLSNLVASNLGVKKKSALAELSFKELFDIIQSQKEKKYRPLEKYPTLERDLAFVINSNILYNDIKEEISGFNKLIKKVELFDVYEGEKLGENKKNLAFHITYQAGRTLTNKEVDKLQAKLVKKLEKKFKAKVRDF